MDQYIVTGMSCAACQARVEKAVASVEGVESVNVSLLTNTMGVCGTASKEDIIKAVEKAGYGAEKKGGDDAFEQGFAGAAPETSIFEEEAGALKDRETPVLKKRLVFSAV
ncbi:MAG: cation transporter, partial [Lachnospiraceae bacterium]|nr:cation transporter [Lachnospiraceae bacterium]